MFILPREHSGRHPALTHSACHKTPKKAFHNDLRRRQQRIAQASVRNAV